MDDWLRSRNCHGSAAVPRETLKSLHLPPPLRPGAAGGSGQVMDDSAVKASFGDLTVCAV